jgi:lipopolysaccharide export system permease protein
MRKSWKPAPTLFGYFGRKYTQWVLLTLGILVSFITLIEVLELMRRVSHKTVEISSFHLVMVSLLNIPTMLDELLPFAVLFGSLSCFFIWNRSHEFMVTRSVGQNVWQAITPVIFSVGAIGLCHIMIINPIAATTAKQHNYYMQNIFTSSDQQSGLSVSTSGIWLRDTSNAYNLIINGQQLLLKEALISQPLLYQLEQNGKLSWRIQADTMHLTEGGWIIKNALRTENNGRQSALGDVIIPTAMQPSDLLESTQAPQTVNVYRLPGFISVLERTGLPAGEHKVFFHQLLSTPLKLIGLALLAASVTLVRFSRQTKLKLILFALGAGFGFYFLTDLIYLLGTTSRLPYHIAGWGPALLVCSISGFLLARADE